MLSSIKRKLQKTPIQNSSTILREGDPTALDTLLGSPHLSEGVFGYEMNISLLGTESIIFTPSLFREPIGKEVQKDLTYLKGSLSEMECYHVVLSKPSFLPLYTQETYSLLENLSTLPKDGMNLFVQFLFTKRSDHWQTDLIHQYEEYLNGNDYPAESRMGRMLQSKILNVLDKVSGFNTKRECIEEIEQKILETGFRFELRLMVHAKEGQLIKDEIKEVLEELNFFNELTLMKAKNKKEFFSCFLDRKFSDVSLNQMISESELKIMISGDVMKNERETIAQTMETIKEDVMGQKQSIFDLLPLGNKLNREVDMEIVERIPSALKKAKTIKDQQVNIKDVELGATVQRVTFEIPENVVYSDIKNKYNDIKAILGTELSIIQGNEPNTITFLIPCTQREIIYLKELIQNPDFLQFAKENPLPFICGIDMFNELVFKCLTQAPHLLVAGATNSGKSVFVNSLLIALILLKHPKDLRLYLIDPKKVEFSQYDGFSHVEKIVTDSSKALHVLDGLVNEMEDRYEKFSKYKGVKKITHYHKKTGKSMPYIICAIDEYNDLKMTEPDVEEMIERLGQKARGAGIHLILATQRPDKNVMSGVIKTNFPSRVAFKLDNNNEYRTVFGTGIPFKNLLGFGDGVIKYIGQTEEFIRFQAPVITLDEEREEEAYEDIKKFYRGASIEKMELTPTPEEPKEEPMDKLKRIIATTGETRLRELQELMNIRINDVSDLLKVLVEEGWLGKEGRSYIVTAPEEELDQYK